MIGCANPLAQYLSHKEEIDEAIARVINGNRYILGPEVEALEGEFAEYIGAKEAIGVANGTDALELSLRALGVGSGDEVITVSHTAVATVAAIACVGATPVLVDVEPNFYTLDPLKLDEVFSIRTKAVIAVHIYGQAADIDAIHKFCKLRGIALIEDVSQAHGAKWNGMRLGSIGDIGCFSCYPTKNLGAIGDAGLITTNNVVLAKKLRMLREYGWKARYVSDIPGRNSRLDELQAAILRVKLRHLDADNSKRKAIASLYSDALASANVILPATREGAEAVFHLYVLRTRQREALIKSMGLQEIQPGIHYPLPIHHQSAYKDRIKTSCSMSITDMLSHEVLSLPMYPELSFSDVERVIKSIL